MISKNYSNIYENETRGYYYNFNYLNNVKRSIKNIFFTVILSTLIIGTTILFTKNGDIKQVTTKQLSSFVENNSNLNETILVPISLSTIIDNNTQAYTKSWIKTRYPTHSPNRTLHPTYLKKRSFEPTEKPTIQQTNIGNSQLSSNKPILVVNDDFHITPIIVVNNDIRNNSIQQITSIPSMEGSQLSSMEGTQLLSIKPILIDDDKNVTSK